MSKCEACGGDGLIEVGAYRGDEDDADTRQCRLCGGVVTLESQRLEVRPGNDSVTATSFKDEHGQVRTLHEVGSAGHAAQQLQQLAHAASESGVRLSRPWEPEKASDVKFVPRAMTAKEVADNYTQRLNEQNEREQHEAERRQRVSQLKLTATCWYRSPDDDADTLRHCRGIESTELIDGIAEFKPAEFNERVTHVKICAAQKSGSCVFPLASEAFIVIGNTLTLKFKPDEMATIASTFVK